MTISQVLPSTVPALIVTIAFMFTLRPLAMRVGLVDRPGVHKSHEGEVPIVGGAAMFAGISVGMLLLGFDPTFVLRILTGSFLLVMVGTVDDGLALPAAALITTQVAVVLIMIFGANLKLADMGDPFGTGIITTGLFMLPFTMLVTLTMVNAYNMIDGLAGSLALVALVESVNISV